MDSLPSVAPTSELVELQARLNLLGDLSRQLQQVRSFTQSLLQPHSNEARKTLVNLDQFSSRILSPETQKALDIALSREQKDGTEVDEYRRALTKPSIVPPR